MVAAMALAAACWEVCHCWWSAGVYGCNVSNCWEHMTDSMFPKRLDRPEMLCAASSQLAMW